MGGDSGSGEGQFSVPRGMALDADGNLYVADWGNDRIQILSASGAVIDTIGETGSGNGQFRLPKGVAVDGDGNVFVLDTRNQRVQKFRPAGGASRRKSADIEKGQDAQEARQGKGRKKRRHGQSRRGRD